MDNIIRFKETTWGKEPPELRPVPERSNPQVVEPVLTAGVTFECPECTGKVDTASAMSMEVTYSGPGKTAPRFRWLGVPCMGCLRTYTVELSEKESEPSGNVTQVPESDKTS